jgi:hypothetical protein
MEDPPGFYLYRSLTENGFKENIQAGGIGTELTGGPGGLTIKVGDGYDQGVPLY